VDDSGPGLDPKFKDRIFEPFFSTKPDGMGMGLMLSRSIIENHGGNLWATDNVPHGAIFHFTLPGNDQSDAPNTETIR
jgi:signal transduction histidine kinase